MRRTRALSIVIAAVLVVALTSAFWPRAEDNVVAAEPTTTTTAPTTTTMPSHGFEAAHASVAEVALYETAGAAEPFDSMSNPTWENQALTFLVTEHGPPGWLQVQLPRRPNESYAWIHDTDVVLMKVQNRIVVQREARVLTVYKGTSQEVLFEAPVAVGTPATPTPLGSFYVDIVVKLRNATGAYGPYQLSVAGFSDVLQTFGNGVGQYAIHGTNHPELIGEFVSNGCIRMHNEDVTSLIGLAVVGTPVEVVE